MIEECLERDDVHPVLVRCVLQPGRYDEHDVLLLHRVDLLNGQLVIDGSQSSVNYGFRSQFKMGSAQRLQVSAV